VSARVPLPFWINFLAAAASFKSCESAPKELALPIIESMRATRLRVKVRNKFIAKTGESRIGIKFKGRDKA
jgi:hypothetical protein